MVRWRILEELKVPQNLGSRLDFGLLWSHPTMPFVTFVDRSLRIVYLHRIWPRFCEHPSTSPFLSFFGQIVLDNK